MVYHLSSKKLFGQNLVMSFLILLLNHLKSESLQKVKKQGIINLILKKDKDITDLKSWRPISILNTDYKILAKILSNRLKVVLKEIINPDQVGYMENRF